MKNVQLLRKELEEKFSGKFALESGTGGTFILTVVDDDFRNISRMNRIKTLLPTFKRSGITPTIIELLTNDEAAEQGVNLTQHGYHLARPGTWDDAIAMVQAGEHPKSVTRPISRPRRVVFYSYKGGVGRTTALVHTAFHLARANKRVVIVDLDVEAPGVHHLVPPTDGTVEAGIVDYLWERQVRPASDTPTVTLVGEKNGRRTGIAYAIRDAIFRNDVYVVPAGQVGFQYVQHLAVLTTRDFSTVSEGELDPWSEFERDVVNQFAPDIILIDARTGINDWGGLSLLRLADDAFIVMYPSVQNAEGVNLVRELLGQIDGARYHIVLSPVPEGDIGAGLIARAKSLLHLRSDGEEAGEDEDSANSKPLVVHYHPSIAAAPYYPVESAMAQYASLANLLLDMNEEERIQEVLQKADPKAIIESLRFPERDAKQTADVDFEAFFQKTVDFDKLLDDARWVVRGRKGTGKSTLYYLFTQHKENAAKRAGGRLVGIDVLSGHGPAETFRPTTDIFQAFQRGLTKGGGDWISFWRAYAVVRLFCSPSSPLDSVLKASKFLLLRSHLTAHFPRSTSGAWEASHTRQLSALFEDSDLSGLCRDSLSFLNKQLEVSGTKIWLMYDDLDQDILEGSPWQQEALGGLLRLIYDTNNQDLHQIRFKVFLREDIWRGLVVTNKSHFGDSRTLLLQWGIEDFLRLAYRLTTRGSEKFRNLAQMTLPLPDGRLDDADESTLRQALAPLWGLNQQKKNKAYTARWVYNRMTDTKGNTYPRSLTILLKKACEAELTQLNSGKPGSSDRLLRPSSLVDGLKAASIERCDALKNEYQDLVPFLDAMQSLRSQFNDADLRPLWKAKAAKQWPSFDKFISHLDDIGLLAVRKEPSVKYRYAVAALYIDGLNMKRVQGETA